MEFETILYSVSDRVGRITFNQPERRNPLSFQMRRELVDALKMAEADDDVRVILLEGAGPVFCSGYNLLQDPDAPKPHGWVEGAAFERWTDQFARSCFSDWMTVWDLLKPVVAKVHGYCMAGGTELMSFCDIAFASDDAVIGYPALRGMSTPDVPYFPWKLPMAHAKYLGLTGNGVTGAEAARMGWIAKSFPAVDLDDRVTSELRALTSVSSELLMAQKASLNHAYEVMGMRTALQQAWQLHALTAQYRPGADDFAKAAMEGNSIAAALAWQNGPFAEEGFLP